jgi:tetratricopeptide (TPR) repeat protein
MSVARLAEFRRALAPALECLRVADLSCIELELDELAATLDLGASERAEIERIRGFVNFRRGNYQQAIDAYRAAAGDLAGDVFRHTTSLMVVARIHYELAQYQEALDAAVQYLRVAPNPSVSEYAFVDRLRQLGATVD